STSRSTAATRHSDDLTRNLYNAWPRTAAPKRWCDMGLLTVVQDVCAVVGVERPTSVFASISSNRTMLEMLAVANEMAQRTAWNTRDWTPLMARGTFTGTLDPRPATPLSPTDESTHALPSDFKRFGLTANLWRSNISAYPMRFVADLDEWL